MWIYISNQFQAFRMKFAGNRPLIIKTEANPALLSQQKFCFYQDLRIHIQQILFHCQNKIQDTGIMWLI